jgi:hypothetical protein
MMSAIILKLPPPIWALAYVVIAMGSAAWRVGTQFPICPVFHSLLS